jgi:hypothetical protein
VLRGGYGFDEADRKLTVVVLATSKTPTAGMLAVLADTTVTGGYVTAVLAGLGKASRHLMVGKEPVESV